MKTGRSDLEEDQENAVPNVKKSGADRIRRHSWDGNTTAIHSVLDTSSTTDIAYDSMAKAAGTTRASKDNAGQNQQPWWKLSAFTQVCSEDDVPNSQKEGLAEESNDSDNQKESEPGVSLGGLRRRTARFEQQQHDGHSGRGENKTDTVHKRRVGISNWAKEGVAGNREERQTTMLSIARLDTPPEGVDTRATQRRATVHYSSSGRPSVMGSKRRPVRSALLLKEDRALDQLRDVFRDYVVQRIKRNSLSNKIKITRQPQPHNKWIVDDCLFVLNELERQNRHLYRNISKQVGVTLRSEDVIRKLFSELASEILNSQNNTENTQQAPTNGLPQEKRITLTAPCSHRATEITWGRIFAILAVAGGLGVDCVQQGHAELVNFLIEYCGEFAHDEGLISWIVAEGGWENFRSVAIDNARDRNDCDFSYFARLCNAVLAFIACSLAAVLVVAIIDGLSNSF